MLQHGAGVRVHYTPSDLCAALEADRAARSSVLVLLAGDHAINCHVARTLRAFDARALVVSLLSFVNETLLLQAMQAGVDACWSRQAPRSHLVTALLRLMGHESFGLAPKPRGAQTEGRGWALVSRGWVVRAPGGEMLTLTTAERAFVLALCRAPGQRLSHRQMLQALVSGSHSQAAPGRAGQAPDTAAARRLSVLLSRLRRKFGAAGIDFPIRSLRGEGYELCVDLHEADSDSGSSSSKPGGGGLVMENRPHWGFSVVDLSA